MKINGIALCLALLFLLISLGGCADGGNDETVTVVCTIFPIYDWVKNVVGESESVEVILLVRDGTDLHSYQPSAQDVVSLCSCDVLIRLGGSTDGWVEEALQKAPSKNRIDLRLTELASLTLREIASESVAQSHEHDHGEHDHEECVVDEHIWLSLSNAETCVAAIAQTLTEVDSDGEERYRENQENYTERLRELDSSYQKMVSEANDPYLVVADRFPFVYLAEEYGIGYLAAYEGCSTDADADAETVIRLARALDERSLDYLVVTESGDTSLAESVIRAGEKKNQEVVTLDSLQSVTAKQLEEGKTYLNTMESNLAVLRRVLSS